MDGFTKLALFNHEIDQIFRRSIVTFPYDDGLYDNFPYTRQSLALCRLRS